MLIQLRNRMDRSPVLIVIILLNFNLIPKTEGERENNLPDISARGKKKSTVESYNVSVPLLSEDYTWAGGALGHNRIETRIIITLVTYIML